MYRVDHYLGRIPKKLKRALNEHLPLRPLSVKIKLTWHCNLACVMCSEWRIQGRKPPRPNYFDSWEKLEPLLNDLIALKAKKIHFSGGEPLMYPWLTQAIRHLSAQGRHVTIVSNGTLWTPTKAQELLAAGLSQITFSLDSPNPTTFQRLRGRNTWQLVLNGIRNARTAIDQLERPVRLKVNTVVTRENFRELVDYPALAHQLGIDRIRLLPVDDLHVESGPGLKLTREELNEYNQVVAPQLLAQARNLVEHPADLYPFGRTERELNHSAQGHYAKGFYDEQLCFAPWLHSLVAADGQVYGCCMLKGEKQAIDKIGPERSFIEVWQGEAYQAFRAQMQQDKYPICDHCDDFLGENRYLNQLLKTV